MQYAISCITVEQLARAAIYFDNAYAYADKRHFDTYQIDNHYARLLLMRAISEDVQSPISNFRHARKIINEQMRKERRYYPYRVASYYKEFYDKYENSLADNQKQEIMNAASYVLEQISKMDEARKSHKYVEECFINMTAC